MCYIYKKEKEKSILSWGGGGTILKIFRAEKRGGAGGTAWFSCLHFSDHISPKTEKSQKDTSMIKI